MKPIVTALGICALLLASSPAYATAYTWEGDTSVNWNEVSNWTGIGFPDDAGDSATIDDSFVDRFYWPQLDTNRTIGSLTMDDSADLDVNSYTLTVTGAFTVSSGSTITISNSSSGGGITAGSFVMNGASTITVSGTTTVQTN